MKLPGDARCRCRNLAMALHLAVDEPRLAVVRQARLFIIEQDIRLTRSRLQGNGGASIAGGAPLGGR